LLHSLGQKIEHTRFSCRSTLFTGRKAIPPALGDDYFGGLDDYFAGWITFRRLIACFFAFSHFRPAALMTSLPPPADICHAQRL